MFAENYDSLTNSFGKSVHINSETNSPYAIVERYREHDDDMMERLYQDAFQPKQDFTFKSSLNVNPVCRLMRLKTRWLKYVIKITDRTMSILRQSDRPESKVESKPLWQMYKVGINNCGPVVASNAFLADLTKNNNNTIYSKKLKKR